jgi:hypothetical protein
MTHADAALAPNYGEESFQHTGTNTLPVDLNRLAVWLQVFVAVILGLGVLREITISYIGTETVLQDLRHFALDAERSLESWYESITMVVSALLLGLIAALSRIHDKANCFHWAFLAVIFTLMSIDASVSFHEVTVSPLREAFDLSGVFYFSWVVLATPLVIAMGLYFIPFLFRLHRQTAIRFIIAGSIFVGGALGTEFLCGYLATTVGAESLAYRITAASQECLEAIGLTIFVIALLKYIAHAAPALRLDFTNMRK